MALGLGLTPRADEAGGSVDPEATEASDFGAGLAAPPVSAGMIVWPPLSRVSIDGFISDPPSESFRPSDYTQE